MKKSILFDNDGVLVDTEAWYFRANQMALEEMGFELTLEYYMKLMPYGGNWWEIALENGATMDDVNAARARRSSYYQEFIKSENIYIDGVEEVLRELSKKYRLAIVTTSRRVDFELIHHDKKLTRFMDFVLCEEDYPRAKPYPDPYLKALKLMDIADKNAVVVEDSQRGLTAAYSANIDCVVVYNHFTANQDFSKATHRIDSLSELLELL